MKDEREPARAKYLRLGDTVGNGMPSNDTAPAVTLTRGELGALVRQAVDAALAEAAASGASRPAVLDRDGLAAALGCGVTMVDKLRRQGMPSFRLGDSPRFELEACLGWLRKDGAA